MQNLERETQSFHLQHRNLSGPPLPRAKRMPLGSRRVPQRPQPPVLDPRDIDQLLGDPRWLDELIQDETP